MSTVSCRVALLCKAPIPGYAKTRLIPTLGPAAAAQLQQELVARSVHTALEANVGPVTLWCAPDASHSLFRQLAQRYALQIRSQPEGDLGVRMHTAACAALREAQAVLLIGSDCPVMDAEYLRRTAAALDAGADVVIGPAEDGGYVLLGLKRAAQAVFLNVPWGDSQVLATTVSRCHALQWRCHVLETLWDVDQLQDVERWRAIRSRFTV